MGKKSEREKNNKNTKNQTKNNSDAPGQLYQEKRSSRSNIHETTTNITNEGNQKPQTTPDIITITQINLNHAILPTQELTQNAEESWEPTTKHIICAQEPHINKFSKT